MEKSYEEKKIALTRNIMINALFSYMDALGLAVDLTEEDLAQLEKTYAHLEKMIMNPEQGELNLEALLKGIYEMDEGED